MSELARAIRPEPPAPFPADESSAFDRATAKHRAKALACEQLVRVIAGQRANGLDVDLACKLLAAALADGTANSVLLDAGRTAGRAGTSPSASSLKRWFYDYQRAGISGLLPRHKGGMREEYGWELRAQALYHIPSKPTYGAVADQLRREGWDSATNARVRRYLQSAPANLGPRSPQRLGRHYYRQNVGPYRTRNTACLRVGEMYTMDGHTVDVYLAHPQSGGIWRPELTVIMDVASRYIAAWYISESESKYSSMLTLSQAMTHHDHVPGWLHVDNGKGFRNKAMSEEEGNYYARFSIQPMFSIPGNSKGRGHIERLFRTIRDKHDKLFMGGMFYCGDDMAPEINRRLHIEVKQGKRVLPSLQQYIESLAAWVEHYNHSQHSGIDGRTPADLWETLVRNPLGVTVDATVRERQTRKVRKGWEIHLDNRIYHHAELARYMGARLAVEYRVDDDSHIWIYDAKDRLICVAPLKSKPDMVDRSRLVEQRKRSEVNAEKRLLKHKDELHARHTNTIEHQAARLDALEELNALPAPQKNTADSEESAAQDAVSGFDNFDPYDTDY